MCLQSKLSVRIPTFDTMMVLCVLLTCQLIFNYIVHRSDFLDFAGLGQNDLAIKMWNSTFQSISPKLYWVTLNSIQNNVNQNQTQREKVGSGHSWLNRHSSCTTNAYKLDAYYTRQRTNIATIYTEPQTLPKELSCIC